MTANRNGLAIGRRSALALLTTAPVVLSSCATAAAPVTTANPALIDFIKMRGALDDELVISFLTGRYYGVQDAVVTPFYGLEAATFARYEPMAGGGFRAASFEIAYFTDLETGAVLDTWRNPYTGETVSVPVTHTQPSLFYVRSDLRIEISKAVPGMVMTHKALPSRTVGDDVWMTEETFVTVDIPGGAPFRYSEIVTMNSKRSQLDNPRMQRVPTGSSYVSAVSWRPWQRMGARTGTLTGQGDGRIGVAPSQMPKVWREATQARFPEILADPAAPLVAALAAGVGTPG